MNHLSISWVFLLLSSLISCSSKKDQDLSIILSQYKHSFSKKLVSHFPETAGEWSGFSSNAREEVNSLGFGFKRLYYWQSYEDSIYYSLLDSISKVADTCFLVREAECILLFPYANTLQVNEEVFKDCEDPEKRALAAENRQKEGGIPVPVFDIEELGGNSPLGLHPNFVIHILDAKPGDLKKVLDSNRKECLPERWYSGFSRGYATQDSSRTILYWVAKW